MTVALRSDHAPRPLAALLDRWRTEEQVCPGCGRPGRGWHERCLQRSARAEEAARRVHRREELLRASALPRREVALASCASFPAALSDLAVRWALGVERRVLLVGEPGVGKTVLAVKAALLRIAELEPVRFVGGDELGLEAEDIRAVLRGAGPLLLDDVDKCRGSEYAAQHLFGALRRRLSRDTPLLLTANIEPAAMAGHWPVPYGPALADRLGGNDFRVVRIEGRSRRFEAR